MGTSSPGLSVLQWPICAGVRSPQGLRGGPRVLRGVCDGGGYGRSLLCVHTLRGRPLRTRVREKGVWAGTSVCTCAGPAHTRGASGFPSYHCALFILSVFHRLKCVTLFFFSDPPTWNSYSEGAGALGRVAASPLGSFYLFDIGWDINLRECPSRKWP